MAPLKKSILDDGAKTSTHRQLSSLRTRIRNIVPTIQHWFVPSSLWSHIMFARFHLAFVKFWIYSTSLLGCYSFSTTRSNSPHPRSSCFFFSSRRRYLSSSLSAADETTTTGRGKMFDGGVAGLEADDDAIWDDTTMSGPLGKTADNLFMERFRTALAASNLKLSSDYPSGYDGMIQIVKEIIETADSAEIVVAKSRSTLNSLFPNWPPTFGLTDRVGLLYWFEILFAKPFPEFSCKLNAWVTWWAAQWLMGPCELHDLVIKEKEEEDRSDEKDAVQLESSMMMIGNGDGQLVKVKRCRYLEAGSCASLCVNSCKLPTQQFFNDDMGVPMRMIPDYKTFECRFEFGIAPTSEDEMEARNVSCFSQCTSKKKRPDGERMVSCGN